jgi:O-antigen/teichoic acid export membrane protein
MSLQKMIFRKISNYLKFRIFSGPQRSIIVKKNIIGSLLIKLANILTGLILLPLTINYVDAKVYGIWLTLAAIVSWFNFFDIGLGNGLKNKLAEALTKKDYDMARIYISTTYALLFILIIPVLIGFFIINPYINWIKILNTENEFASDIRILIILVFISFAFQFILKLISVILSADQKTAKASSINLVSNIVTLVIIYILTKTTTGSLVYLGLTLSGVPLVVYAGYNVWLYTTKYKYLIPSIRSIDLKYTKELGALGIQFFIIQIAAVTIYTSSNILITQLFGSSSVTSYNVSFKYFSVITMFFNIVVAPMWVANTEAYHRGDILWIKNTTKKLITFWSILSIIVVLMVAIAAWVYKIWVGNSVIIPFYLSLSIALFVILNTWNSIFVSFLNGVGKIRIQVIDAIVQIVTFIPLSIYFSKTLGMGIAGIVLASTVPFIFGSFWTVIQYRKIINNRAYGLWGK